MTGRWDASRIGSIIEGRYKLLALLGSGAFGLVYKAKQLATDQRGPIPVRQACRLMTQVLEALGRAHRDGVVHRDLKPHNIKVTSASFAAAASTTTSATCASLSAMTIRPGRPTRTLVSGVRGR